MSCYKLSKIIKFILIMLIIQNQWINGATILFDKITTQDGLSNDMVLCMLQDKMGFLWFGTRNGLNKYDGHDFTVYKNIPSDSSSLLDNSVFAIYEDEQHRLWIATDKGVNLFNRKTENFKRFKVKFPSYNDSPNSLSGGIVSDQHGNIWYGNQINGLFRLNISTGLFKKYKLDYNKVSSIHKDNSNNLWVGTFDGRVNKYQPVKDKFKTYLTTENDHVDIRENFVWIITENYSGELMVATSIGVFKYDNKSDAFFSYNKSNLSGSFRNNEIRFFFEEVPGIQWIGTYGKGLIRFDKTKNQYRNFQVQPNNPNGINNNDVNVIYKDRSGVLWIGTQQGINKVDPAKNLFTHYQHDPNKSNSLILNFVTAFCEDENGRIWIGTYGGGIDLFNRNTGTFEHYQHKKGQPSSLASNAVRAIEKDAFGRLWIGTMEGLDVYEHETNSFHHISHGDSNKFSISGKDIMAVISNDNNIWVGTYGDGLNKIVLDDHGDIKHIEHFKASLNGISHNYIRDIYIDINGIVWIGTLGGGLNKYDPVTGSFTRYTHDPEDPKSIGHNLINSIQEDKDGNLWIGTWGGLMFFDRSLQEFSRYTIEDGLADDMISEIQIDKKGNVWVSTFNGLTRIHTSSNEEKKIINYSVDNGLQGNKFNVNASLKTSSDELLFGGTTGFNIFHPSQIPVNKYIPPVHVTELYIFNERIEIGKKYDNRVILEKSVSSSKSITLKHKYKVVSFNFAALSYSMIEQNQFAHRLEGVDKSWSYHMGPSAEATYSNLQPGEYILNVRASNNNGIWNEQGTQLIIEVLPPPWKTWWAYSIYAFFIAFILYLARNYSISKATLQNKIKFEQLEREKSEEINQLKFKFFTNISHEFRTPLTLILGPLEKLLQSNQADQESKRQLFLMHRNSKRLLHLINQLMDFRKMETGNLKLRAKESDIIRFIHEIKNAFNDFADSHNISFFFNTNVKSLALYYDEDKIEKILYNLLSNAFKFTPNDGKIEVVIYASKYAEQPNNSENHFGKKVVKQIQDAVNISSKVNENYSGILIYVRDTGIGISKDRLNKIFDRFYQIHDLSKLKDSLRFSGTGIGLALTKELVELHQGEISVRSREGEGTEFKIWLPAGKEHLKEEEIVSDDTQLAYDQYSSLKYLPELTSIIDQEEEEMEYEILLENKHSQSVLIIDDNEEIVSFIKDCLKDNYIIYTASNGTEGLTMANKIVPDIVISDVMMPNMDGTELVKHLKTDMITSHIPVILLTAYHSIENNIKGFDVGADDYIPKPFNENLLKSRIENLILLRKTLLEKYSENTFLEPKKLNISSLDERFLKKAMEIVEKQMSDIEFGVDRLSKELALSRAQLFRKMKSLTGKTPTEFIRNFRLKRAADLLKLGYNVSEVTYEVGISSRSYFNKCFQEEFGNSPTEYIAKNKTNLN